MYGGHATVHIGVVHFGNHVLVCSSAQIVLQTIGRAVIQPSLSSLIALTCFENQRLIAHQGFLFRRPVVRANLMDLNRLHYATRASLVLRKDNWKTSRESMGR